MSSQSPCPETPRIKEEPEEPSIKPEDEQLPVCVLDPGIVCVKVEEVMQPGESGSAPETQSAPGTRAYGNIPDMFVAGEEKKRQCTVCHKCFGAKQQIMMHFRVHAGEKPFSCSVCKKTFPQRVLGDAHQRTHTGAITFNCSICQIDFADLFHFKTHLSTHKATPSSFLSTSRSKQTMAARDEKLSETQRNQPPSAGVLLPRAGIDLIQEVSETPQIKEEPKEPSVKQEDEPQPVCVLDWNPVHVKPEDESAPATSASVHDQDTSRAGVAEEENECPFCSKTFGSRQRLQQHIRVHTEDAPYCCTVCNKECKGASFLNTHMRSHQRPHGCPACHKAFPQKAHLERHMRVHTGERPHSCSFCGKSFARKFTLELHTRTRHTGERPYSCGRCNTSYADKYSLRRHVLYTRTHVAPRAAPGPQPGPQPGVTVLVLPPGTAPEPRGSNGEQE